MRLRRRPAPRVPLAVGERVLAWTTATDGTVLAGSQDALHLVPPEGSGGETVRVPWEQVEAAGWDRETDELRVTEVGTWGEPRREHRATITDPGRFLELVRERVTASVLLQRHVPLEGRRGVRVIARRAPRGLEVAWMCEYDEGVDPDDPQVAPAVRDALARARADVGLDQAP